MGTPKLKLIVRVEQEKRRHCSLSSSPSSDDLSSSSNSSSNSYLPKFPRGRDRGPKIQKLRVLRTKVVAAANLYVVYHQKLFMKDFISKMTQEVRN